MDLESTLATVKEAVTSLEIEFDNLEQSIESPKRENNRKIKEMESRVVEIQSILAEMKSLAAEEMERRRSAQEDWEGKLLGLLFIAVLFVGLLIGATA